MTPKFAPLLAVLVLGFVSDVHAQFTEQSRRESTKEFERFDLPEPSQWIGDSKTVKHEPLPEATDSWRIAGVTININALAELSDGTQFQIFIPPIKLVSFRQDVASDARATVSESDETSSARMSRHHSASDELPLYANVWNESGTLLSNSQAYSQQDGTADENTIQAHGRVGTYADIRSSLSSDDSFAAATASSSVTTRYSLTQEFDFILDATLAAELAEDGFSFRLRDISSEIDIISFQPQDGQSHRLELCGTLSPGIYDLIVDTESKASIHTSGDPDFGGIGEFDLYFRAFQTKEQSKSDLPSPTSVGLDALRPIEWTFSNGSIVFGAQPVPEPDGHHLLLVGFLLIWIHQRKMIKRSSN